MGASIAATAYIFTATLAAYFLRPRFADSPATLRAMIFWFAVTPFLYFIYPILGALFFAGILLIALAPKGAEDRLIFYLIALFAVPLEMQSAIPFPGINYLLAVDFPLIACLILLAPVLAGAKRPVAARHAPAPGVFILLMTALFSILLFRTENITNGLRGVIDYAFLYAIPFMAIIRMAPDLDRFDKVFAGLLTLNIIWACLAFVSEATDWNFYTLLIERHGLGILADVREGVLRVRNTVMPVLAGYVAVLGLLSIEYFRAQKRVGLLAAWFYRFLFTATAIFSFSRGAWLALGVAVVTYFFFTKFPRGLRPISIAIGVAFLLPAVTLYALQSDLNRLDPYGSFEYRQELLRTSIDYIGRYPLFGDANYRESGAFDHLYQGQGIIDIVNLYLGIALSRGLVGLGLFLGGFISVGIGLLRLGKIVRRANDTVLECQRAVLLGALSSYLALVATVSGVSLVLHLGIAILALSTAFLAAARKAEAETKPRADADRGSLFG